MNETELVLSKGKDLAKKALARGEAFSHFLSPAQQETLGGLSLPAGVSLVFDGKFPQAERKRAVFFTADAPPPAPIDVLQIVCAETLEHRAILGSLLASGIRREMLGDILVSQTPPLVLCDPEMREYLCREVTKIGGAPVRIEPSCAQIAPPQTIPRTFTVASLRLDSVTAEGFRLSRARAAEAIRTGLVRHNDRTATAPDAPVRQGDRISLRGTGKLRVDDIGGKSKKDRIFLTVQVYH